MERREGITTGISGSLQYTQTQRQTNSDLLLLLHVQVPQGYPWEQRQHEIQHRGPGYLPVRSIIERNCKNKHTAHDSRDDRQVE